MNIALAAITKPVVSLETELASAPPPAFFRRMTREFTGDETTERMGVAIGVMRARFPNMSMPDQLTWVLAHAAQRGNIMMIDYLLAQGALIDGSGRVAIPGVMEPAHMVPVNYAISAGKVEALGHLLKKGANPNAAGRQYLHNAAYIEASPAMTSLLLKAGAKAGLEETLLGVVLNRHRFDVADVLIKEGKANVNAANAKLAQEALKDAVDASSLAPPPVPGRALEYLARNGADFAGAVLVLETTRPPTMLNKKAAELGRKWMGRVRIVRGRRMNFV